MERIFSELFLRNKNYPLTQEISDVYEIRYPCKVSEIDKKYSHGLKYQLFYS